MPVKLTLLNAKTNRVESVPPQIILYTADKLRNQALGGLFERLVLQSTYHLKTTANPSSANVLIASPDVKGPGILVAVAAPDITDDDNYTKAQLDYLMYSTAYNQTLKLTNVALAGAQAALDRLKTYLKRFGDAQESNSTAASASWRNRFYEPLYSDLNTPRALAILWTMLQSDLADGDKKTLLEEFTTVLGLAESLGINYQLATPKFNKTPSVSRKPVPKKESQEIVGRRRITRTNEVRSLLDQPDRFDFTVSLIAYNNLRQVEATVKSLTSLLTRSQRTLEVIAVEMNGKDAAADYLEGLAAQFANFKVIYTQQNLGEAAGRNLALRQSRGSYVVLLDAGLTLKVGFFEELWKQIENQPTTGLYGLQGLELTNQADHFQPSLAKVEALQGSLLCLRRSSVDTVGFLDEHFRLPYALDLDYSFAVKDKGLALMALPSLQAFVSQPTDFKRPSYDVTLDQQERQHQKNWQLFLRSWNLE